VKGEGHGLELSKSLGNKTKRNFTEVRKNSVVSLPVGLHNSRLGCQLPVFTSCSNVEAEHFYEKLRAITLGYNRLSTVVVPVVYSGKKNLQQMKVYTLQSYFYHFLCI